MIAEPTPQKQKAACSSGEPHKIIEKFQCIIHRHQTFQDFAKWLNRITPFNFADLESTMNVFGFHEIAF